MYSTNKTASASTALPNTRSTYTAAAQRGASTCAVSLAIGLTRLTTSAKRLIFPVTGTTMTQESATTALWGTSLRRVSVSPTELATVSSSSSRGFV